MQISPNVTMRRVTELREHPDNDFFNSRLSEREEAALRASIAQYGIQEAILCRPNGTVLSGHTRVDIAIGLGLTEVPTRTVECTDQEGIYLLVAMNEGRRGDEKDLIKKALRLEILYKNWKIHSQRTDSDINKALNLEDPNVKRLRKLLYLIPEFQKEVSQGRLGLIAGSKIAALDPNKQRKFFWFYEVSGTPTAEKIEKMLLEFHANADPHSILGQRRKQSLEKKVEKVRKEIAWLITTLDVDRDIEELWELKRILIEYADYIVIRRASGGEVDS